MSVPVDELMMETVRVLCAVRNRAAHVPERFPGSLGPVFRFIA
jgi:hypothetical protein